MFLVSNWALAQVMACAFSWHIVAWISAYWDVVCHMALPGKLSLWCSHVTAQIARFMGPKWGPPGAGRTQVGPMWATWSLLSALWHGYTMPTASNTELQWFLHCKTKQVIEQKNLLKSEASIWLTHWCQDKMTISQMTFSSTFPWRKLMNFK